MKSNVMKLVAIYECDLEFSSDWAFPLRLELFKDTERRGWFRAHVWEQESFNIQPTFQVGTKTKRRYQSTEQLLLERSTQLSGQYNYVKARSENHAIAKVVEDLKERLAHWTGAQAK